MGSVWGELKRRNVVKVAVAYAVVGWLLVQVADVFFPALQLPQWTVTLVAALLIIGFPVALLLSWAYELTPEGVKRLQSVPLSENVTKVAGRNLDFAIIGLLVLTIVLMVVGDYLPDSGSLAGAELDPASLERDVIDRVPRIDEADEQGAVLPNSVAVLLCDNLSPDPDDAFFAAGIHEEILNQLTKLQSLNPIARTSVLRYADNPPPLSQIAEELRVETVMECSVRYAGDAILVTAQLIDPQTNLHLWSESYDGDLSDLSTMFAMQANIATNIAIALEAQFSLAEQESIRRVPTEDPAAWTLYLRAISAASYESARSALDQAIARDQDFGLAYLQRATISIGRLIGVGTNTTPDEALELEQKIVADAQRALEIDPTLGRAQAVLAVVHQANWRGAEAEQAFQRALALSPNDVWVLWRYGEFKRFRGDYDEAVRLAQRAIDLDPNDLIARLELGITHRFAGDWDAAAEVFQNVVDLDPTLLGNLGLNIQLGLVEASRGNTAEAVRRLELAQQLGTPPAYRLAQMAHVHALVGRPDEAAAVFAEFEEQARQEDIGDGWWAYAYIAVGDYVQALQRVESAVNRRVNADQVALLILAANTWKDPQLESEDFRAVLGRLWIN